VNDTAVRATLKREPVSDANRSAGISSFPFTTEAVLAPVPI
jgi:hypothetical protein